MIKVIQADITTLKVDAVVNAAKNSLLGGGGIDGAIHRAAGPKLLEECRTLGGCPTGSAKLTKGYNLPAKWIIHTVGPVWIDGKSGEERFLADCYRNSLVCASQMNMMSIVFPCISTGIYGYPFDKATNIAIKTVKDFLKRFNLNIEVTFCCFSKSDYDYYKNILEQ